LNESTDADIEDNGEFELWNLIWAWGSIIQIFYIDSNFT
jgi:hypothetical protein